MAGELAVDALTPGGVIGLAQLGIEKGVGIVCGCG
jgi:hypothetical protein